MRPTLLASLGLIVTGVVAGCTLLVPFDDPPPLDSVSPGDDDNGSSSSGGKSSTSSSGGSTSSTSSSGAGPTSSSSSSSTSSSGATAAYPPKPDTTNLAGITCTETGTFCGLNGTTDDLVECDGTTPKAVFHCTMGCAHVGGTGSGVHQCADCNDPPSGGDRWYCGKNVQWPADVADYAYECQNGHVVNGNGSPGPCGKDPGTGVSRCHTTCTRTNLPKLPGSCCQQDPDN